MRMDPQPYEVRELVVRTFRDFDIAVDNPFDLDETILVDRGRYAGRSYRVDGCLAKWLAAIGIVEFYDAEGHMLHSVNLSEELEPQRMAA